MLILVLAVGGALFGPPVSSAVAATCPTREGHAIHGWIHPCGTELVDGRGHVVRPMGVALWSMSHDLGRTPSLCTPWARPPRDLYPRLERWGFNSVLLYVSWANVEPTPPAHRRSAHPEHHYNLRYLRVLDRVIERFGNHGIKVILDMANDRWSSAFTNMTLPNGFVVPCGSGMPAWLYPNGGGLREMVRAERGFFSLAPRSRKLQRWFAKAWTRVAARYRGNPDVIGAVILHEAYDLLGPNYPGSEDITPADLHLAEFYEREGGAIHRANRHLSIFTPDRRDWNTQEFALTRRPSIRRGVYTFEFFARGWTHSGLPRMEAYWGRAREWRRPAWVEEFFAYLPTAGGEPPRRHWDTKTAEFMAYVRDRHIGWSFAPYTRLPENPHGLLEALQAGF